MNQLMYIDELLRETGLELPEFAKGVYASLILPLKQMLLVNSRGPETDPCPLTLEEVTKYHNDSYHRQDNLYIGPTFVGKMTVTLQRLGDRENGLVRRIKLCMYWHSNASHRMHWLHGPVITAPAKMYEPCLVDTCVVDGIENSFRSSCKALGLSAFPPSWLLEVIGQSRILQEV
jgi:hypothetical protein